MMPIRTPEVKAIISVDGEIVPFISIKISQEMCEHHEFELLLDHKTFDAAFFNNPEEQINLIHTKVIVDLFDEGSVPYVFAGIVTNVRMLAREGDHGGLLLTGKSYTIELERGEICQTYSNTNLTTILREITKGTAYLRSEIIPEWEADIDFAIQYGEDDWRFLQRILHQYQERYFYSGVDLIIGPHPEKPVKKLTYDHELKSFEICSRLLPNEYSHYQYHRENHATLRQNSPSQIENATSNLQLVSQKSDRLTKQRKPNTPIEAYVPDMDSLIKQVNRKKVANGGQMIYVKGEAKTSDVLIGRLIQINMPKSAGGADMGIFRIYKVIHFLDETGHYSCSFEAIPADLKYIPTPKVPVPTPNLSDCEVWSNEDPLGIGRIKVKFPFDERVCSTWIPVMTPDAGGNGSGLGPVSRGFSFLPEVSDSVLVGFIDGPQLSHPVVVGSMFHGANAAILGGGKGNHIKTIRDKSSGEFIMNTDEGGDWGITIKDRRGNIIHVDTRGQNINITAPETVTISAKNIVLNAEENIESQAGIDIISTASNDMVDYAGNDLKQTAKCEIMENSDTRTELVDQEYFLQSFSIDSLASEISIFSEEEDMTLQSGKVVTINSAEKTNQF